MAILTPPPSSAQGWGFMVATPISGIGGQSPFVRLTGILNGYEPRRNGHDTNVRPPMPSGLTFLKNLRSKITPVARGDKVILS